MIQKLAFVDHSFHQKSTATFFLMDLLRQAYDVDIFWDESWLHGPRADLKAIAEGGYDVVLLFQLIDRYTPEEIVRCGFRNETGSRDNGQKSIAERDMVATGDNHPAGRKRDRQTLHAGPAGSRPDHAAEQGLEQAGPCLCHSLAAISRPAACGW